MQISNWHDNMRHREDVSCCPEFRLLSKLYKQILLSSFAFFEDKSIEYITVPATTGSVSSPTEPGSDSSPVVIEVNGRSTMFIDSAQFYLEYACRAFRDGCFYFGHSFRNEYPDNRHLSQFRHVEAEIPGTLEDVKKLVENYIKAITSDIWKRYSEDLIEFEGIQCRVDGLLNNTNPFKSISFDEAYKVLLSYEGALEQCADEAFRISPYGESILLNYFGDFLWIEKWHKLAVPFYQASNNQYALNADLLFGIGEVVGAGQRHVTSNELTTAIKDHLLNESDYEWYIKMKELSPLQTSGFGMGVERYLMWLLNVSDIRNIELFPRDRNQMGLI